MSRLTHQTLHESMAKPTSSLLQTSQVTPPIRATHRNSNAAEPRSLRKSTMSKMVTIRQIGLTNLCAEVSILEHAQLQPASLVHIVQRDYTCAPNASHQNTLPRIAPSNHKPPLGFQTTRMVVVEEARMANKAKEARIRKAVVKVARYFASTVVLHTEHLLLAQSLHIPSLNHK